MNCNDEWYTPQDIIDRVHEVLGTIDLDPASCYIANERVKAAKYYTEEDDGLSKEWFGKVYCNPPYSAKLIKKFTTKIGHEFQIGNVSEFIMLTNSGTDTQWNTPLTDGLQAYTNGRIRFMTPENIMKGAGSRGQLFTYNGPNKTKFIEVFTRDNFCWVPNLQYFKEL